MATFAKLKDGSWGVRVPGAAPKIGDVLTVTKRDGSTSKETVAAVLWSGPDNDGQTVSLCSIKEKPRGRHGNGGDTCAECGRGGALVEDLEDGLMKHYRCCDIPP